MKHKSNILLLSFLITIFSCHKNEEFITTENVDDPPKITISTTHVVQVKDEYGKTIDDFTATLAGKEISSSIDIPAILDCKKINKHGEIISIKDKLGNVSELLLQGVENDINYHHLTLFTSKNKSTFTSSEIKDLKIDERINISTIPNSYFDQNVPYTNDVYAIFYHIDIKNEHQMGALPSIRKGVKSNGSLQFLNIVNAFFLNLEGNQGNPLQAKLQMEAYNDEVKKGNLKLWHCDLSAAIWKEIEVISENNKLSFEFKKSGYYCFSSSTPGVYVSGQVTYNDKPVSKLNIDFKSLTTETYTTASGRWFSFVPAQSDVKSEINSTCNTLGIYDFRTQNSEIDNLKWALNQNSTRIAKITGQVKDCEGKLYTNFIFNQHIGITNVEKYFLQDKIDIYIPVCDQNQIRCSVSNTQGNEKSKIVNWPVNNIIETGSWFACNQAQNSFFNLTIAGENKVYFDTKSLLHSDGRMALNILGTGKIPLIIYTPKDGEGMKSVQDLNIVLDEPNFGSIGYEIKCPSSRLGCGFEKLVITHDGKDEDSMIRGYFQGRFWLKEVPSQKAGYKNMEGEFQILRTF